MGVRVWLRGGLGVGGGGVWGGFEEVCREGGGCMGGKDLKTLLHTPLEP